MAAVAGSQDTQATQLQLLVLHQLYKPYISGEFNFSSTLNAAAAFAALETLANFFEFTVESLGEMLSMHSCHVPPSIW